MKIMPVKPYTLPSFERHESDDSTISYTDLPTVQASTGDGRTNPVLIVDERTSDAAPTILFAQAWSAGVEQPFQRVRSAALAHELGARMITPNTVGMAEKSPRLTSAERRELLAGKALLVGRVAVDSAFNTIEQIGQDVPNTVHVVATSQGPLLVPGMLSALRERGVSVGSVSMFTPASNRENGRIRQLPGLMINMVLNAPKRMKEYRSQNPDYLSTDRSKDTNILRSLARQFGAHIRLFPTALLRQNLADQIYSALSDIEQKPTVNVFAAEYDKVSKLTRNKKLVDKLNELGISAKLHVLEGQHHAVTEHIPYIASLLRPIVRPDTMG